MFLFVANRFDLSHPMNILLIGVKNGGSVQVWRSIVAEGSRVIAVDADLACSDLDIDVHVGDVHDRAWLETVLENTVFDLIIDSTGNASGVTWPWLKVGGFLLIENYVDERVRELMTAITTDTYTWLPYEEILGVTYHPHIALVEKRNPRVVPYLDIIVGSEDPIVPEAVFTAAGGKRVTVSKELLENL
jgi:hypothetical protein